MGSSSSKPSDDDDGNSPPVNTSSASPASPASFPPVTTSSAPSASSTDASSSSSSVTPVELEKIDVKIGEGRGDASDVIVDNSVYNRIKDLFNDADGDVKFSSDQLRAIFRRHQKETVDNNVSREQGNLARLMRLGSERYNSTMRTAAQLNEALNSNKYIETAMKRDADRVSHLNQTVKEEVAKAALLHKQEEYDLNYRTFLATGIVVTLLSTAVMGALLGQWMAPSPTVPLSDTAFYVLSGVVGAAYAVGMAFLFVENSRRRKYNYDHRNWNPQMRRKRKNK